MFYCEDLPMAVRACRIMTDAHEGQQRDGGARFREHPFRVALTVADDVALFGRELLEPYSRAEAVAAALVHDVLEDVEPALVAEYEKRIHLDLGPQVLELAKLLRNPSKDLPKHTPRPEKKALDCAHYRNPALHPVVRLIKLNDRPDNLNETAAWGDERCKGYIDESVALRAAIMDGLWDSVWAARYGETATTNAFRSAYARYGAALRAACERVGITYMVIPEPK